MRRIKEALFLSLDKGLNQSQVAGALALARSTVQDYLHRAKRVGLASDALATLTEEALEKMLFRREQMVPLRPEPDCPSLHAELRKTGVTLQLLWEEYKNEHANGLGYTQFCERYRAYVRKLSLSMRQTHKAGEKGYVDYSGKKPHLVDKDTGEVKPVNLFVLVLGASNYTYAEAQENQSLPNWLGGHARAFAAFECVPHHIVPDCLKDAVTKSHRYDPDLNETYVEMCRHYGCAPLPARPLHPKDKAKVEVGVQVVQRWILARLRNRVFYTLEELNAAVFELTAELNARKMRHLGKTRLELFLELDKPAALPLPKEPFRFYAWHTCKVGIDYCIQVEKHYYSVPYIHVGEQVGVRVYEKTVEIVLGGERIALHVRSHKPFTHTIAPEHMPERHKKHLAWTPHRLIAWAEKTGPNTAGVIKAIFAGKPYVEMAFRPALGVIHLLGGDVAQVEVAGQAVEAEAVRHAQAGGPNLGPHVRFSFEGIIGRDRIFEPGIPPFHVDAVHFSPHLAHELPAIGALFAIGLGRVQVPVRTEVHVVRGVAAPLVEENDVTYLTRVGKVGLAGPLLDHRPSIRAALAAFLIMR